MKPVIRDNRGFTLVELVVVMGIFVILMLLMTSSFETILGKAGQQMKLASTNTEGIVGLEMLRSDLEHAGFGLPWSFSIPPAAPFQETASSPTLTGVAASGVAGIDSSSFNEATPRAIQSKNAPSSGKIIDGSSNTNPGTAYLVIKGTNIGMSDAGKRWSHIVYQSSGTTNSSYIYPWPSLPTGVTSPDNFVQGDRVITLVSTFTTNGIPDKQLVMDGSVSPAAFSYPVSGNVTWPATSSLQVPPQSDIFKPGDGNQIYLVYGVDSVNLRMPYNRADYFVARPASMPASCNPGTGVLYKGVVQQSDPSTIIPYPLLACVGDMQVEYEIDYNNNGNVSPSPTLTFADGTTPLAASDVRNLLKNVRVYILTHEGRKDPGYSYSGDTVQVGDPVRSASSGRTWTAAQMQSTFGSDWRNYRWKVYTIVVHPKNLD